MTPRHRAEEFRRFLNLVERSVPADLDIHIIADSADQAGASLLVRTQRGCPGSARSLLRYRDRRADK